MVQGTTGFAVLQGRVDAGQPVGTRVAWNGGGAHFTMVAGYDNNGNTIRPIPPIITAAEPGPTPITPRSSKEPTK
jgi:hypothetical protein